MRETKARLLLLPQLPVEIPNTHVEQKAPPALNQRSITLPTHDRLWLADVSVAKMRRSFQRHKAYHAAIFRHGLTLFHKTPFCGILNLVLARAAERL
jgi:hypothetical protein